DAGNDVRNVQLVATQHPCERESIRLSALRRGRSLPVQRVPAFGGRYSERALLSQPVRVPGGGSAAVQQRREVLAAGDQKRVHHRPRISRHAFDIPKPGVQLLTGREKYEGVSVSRDKRRFGGRPAG